MYSKIKQLMDERGTTAYELSKATGIGQGNISSWKSGKSNPGVKALRKVADFFKVPISFFYSNNNGNDGEYQVPQTKINTENIGGDQIKYAGDTPPSGHDDYMYIGELMDIWGKLKPEQKKEILDYARYKLSQK